MIANDQKALSNLTVKELLEIAKKQPHYLYDIVTVVGVKYFLLNQSLDAEKANTAQLVYELNELREYIQTLQHNDALFILPDSVEMNEEIAKFAKELNFSEVLSLPESKFEVIGYTFNAYQEAASHTANNEGLEIELTSYGSGIARESRKMVDAIKKHVRHGQELDVDSLTKGLGEALWYIANIARLAGISLDMIARKNIEKSQNRAE